MSEENLDRRDLLEAALDAAEEGTLEAPIEKDIEVAKKDDISEESAQENNSPIDMEKRICPDMGQDGSWRAD